MCGIAGYLTSRAESGEALLGHVATMSDAIAHRGPDGDGAWCDVQHGIALGHRRLAVVNLSPQGRQPMASDCGRYVVVYNGEIYNHLALRRELPGAAWRGHSDTETLLACFSRLGVLGTLPRLVGMFAFAVWDRQKCSLMLVRDRMGEKPLYYGRLPSGDFIFGSELKALRAHPRWQGDIDRNALALFMRHNAVPAPHSIYQGIAKLSPGCWIEISGSGAVRDGRYWNTVDAARQPRNVRTDRDAIDALERVLLDAVRGQIVADVPLGAFLSGGVDSSTVVALMAKASPCAVRTFAIGFSEQGFDESAHAKAVARHLGTDHTELYVTPRDALAVIPRLPMVYDEPFADSSQIPTLLLSQMTRRHVTVSLSGDGGDELFAGYNRYVLAGSVWRKLDGVPLALRRLAADAILAVRPGKWDVLAGLLGKVLPRLRAHGAVGDKLHKFAASVLPTASPQAMYRSLASHWQKPADVVIGAEEPPTALDDFGALGERSAWVDQMCLTDQLTYLPDDILVKVDRAAMSASLETRIPMLDHRVIEFAWSLPLHQKMRFGQTKWLLRQVLYRHVPRGLVERPKQGFTVPLDRWLRGELRDWAEHLLDPVALRQAGLLNAPAIRQKWCEHLDGRRNWQFLLWDVLMFQAWLPTSRESGSLEPRAASEAQPASAARACRSGAVAP